MGNKKIHDLRLIDSAKWDRAEWSATGYFFDQRNNNLPCLGFIFNKNKYGKKIFKQWYKQFGSVDIFEELRVSIIDGLEDYDGIGYVVHLSSDPLQTHKRLESLSIKSDYKKIGVESLFQSMNPHPGSNHLADFRQRYEELGEYAVTPLYRKSFGKGIGVNLESSIIKKTIHFRKLKEIENGDPDWPIFKSGILHLRKGDVRK